MPILRPTHWIPGIIEVEADHQTIQNLCDRQLAILLIWMEAYIWAYTYVYRAPDVDLNIEKTHRPKDSIPSAQGLNTQSCS